MWTLVRVSVCVLGGLLLTSSEALAQRGPALETLVRLDESKYDMATRTSVERSNVLHRTSKQIFDREIFRVKERPAPAPVPQEVFIVQEQQVVTRSVQDSVPVWVVVERNPTTPPPTPEPGWRYRIR